MQTLEKKKKRALSVRKYSIEDMNKLVLSIVQGTTDTEQDIAVRIGKNKGYISQCRSRNEVPNRLIHLLQNDLKNKTARSGVELTVNDMIVLTAQVQVLFQQLSMIMGKTQGRSAAECYDELEQNVQIALRGRLKG